MVENRNESLTTALLGNVGSEGNGKARSEAAAGVAALGGTPSSEQQDGASWTLLERAEVIKIMLEQEANSQQGGSLGIEKIDLVLTAILGLETPRRLNPHQIIAISAAIFKKSYTGDKYQMIIEEVRRLENHSDLQEIIQNCRRSHSTISRTTQEPHPLVVSEEKYEDIMEIEANRLMKPDFIGHTKEVNSVAVSADGRFIVSGSDDNTIKVWNIQERREECTFTGHTSDVSSVAVSADGRFIVSGSEDNTIKVWNIQERREECTFTGHTNYVLSVAVSADGRFIVSGSDDNTIKVWNIQERREECTFTGHTNVVLSVAVSADGRFIVSGSEDNTIKVWNIQERREECTFTGHTNAVSSVAVSADGRFIVSGSEDNTIKVWNIQERREECTFTGHTSAVSSVAVSADGRFIVSGS